MANQVHSWHINPGGKGDSAIHLLTGPPAGGGSSKRTIISSVLIDGGENIKSTIPLKQTIKAIRNLYDCTQPTGTQPYHSNEETMRFDTIMVSRSFSRVH
jgi:hypothetical protein